MQGFKITTFGIIRVSLDVRIVNIVMQFECVWISISTLVHLGIVQFFWARSPPPESEGAHMPMPEDVVRVAVISLVTNFEGKARHLLTNSTVRKTVIWC